MLYNFGLQCFASLRQRSYLSTFFTVEKLSVIAEGAIVPDKSYVAGNPAFVIKEADRCEVKSSCLLGLLKVLWLGFELYLLERCC